MFKFKVFILLNWLLHQGWRTEFILSFNLISEDKTCISTFLIDIYAKENATNFVKDLNSACRVHFIW